MSVAMHRTMHRLLGALFLAAGVSAADLVPPTIQPALVVPATVRPGETFKVTYHFAATGKMAASNTVFVHFQDAHGKTVGQGDHGPVVPTDTADWNGTIDDRCTQALPDTLPDGTYTIVAGLYNKAGRVPLTADGVKDNGDQSYTVGTVTLDRNAPATIRDSQGAKTLDLTGYHETFVEEFDKPLSVSAKGPDTQWTAHTPWNGDFGDAAFADPQPGFPFTVDKGILRIEARKDEAFKATDQWKRSWRAGLIASNDPRGKGFAQQYGYFVMRAKLPPGKGVWPAFWLSSSFDRTDAEAGKNGSVEIDVLEYYGDAHGSYMSTVHVWEPQPHRAAAQQLTTLPDEVTSGFHDYGVLVDPAWVTMYFDGVEMWKTKTPAEHNKPLMLLVNLALGGGWPIDQVPNPSFMDIDYVKVFAKK